MKLIAKESKFYLWSAHTRLYVGKSHSDQTEGLFCYLKSLSSLCCFYVMKNRRPKYKEFRCYQFLSSVKLCFYVEFNTVHSNQVRDFLNKAHKFIFDHIQYISSHYHSICLLLSSVSLHKGDILLRRTPNIKVVLVQEGVE